VEVVIIQFDAPLMSFGAPIVDNRGEIQPFPALSMLTGLVGNALGFEHGEFDRLQRLQQRLRHASREDRRGQKIRDYQTVDLGQDFMDDSRAWTTDGALEERAGASGGGIHIRLRDYWADAVHTVALTLEPADDGPELDELADALRRPERPLFIGRKTCLPAMPLVAGTRDAESLPDALEQTPLHPRADGRECRAWWPVDPGENVGEVSRPVTDRRDWSNQIHVGERWIAEGVLEVETTEEES